MVMPVRALLPVGSSFHGFSVETWLIDVCRAPLQAFAALEKKTGRGARIYCMETNDRTRAGREAFQARLNALRLIEHERIPRILDGGVEGDLLWVAVDRPEGTSLSEQLAAGEPLDPMQTVLVLRDVIAPLRLARDAGLLHGRLTPRHLLVTGIECRAVLEVGFDRLFGARDEGHDLVFRAPEQLDPNGEVDERTDIYALGTIAYFALGSPPFEDTAGNFDPDRVRARTAQEELPPLSRVRPSCPPELEALARLMCAKLKGDRPRTLELLDEMLTRALAACVAQRKGRPLSSAAPVVAVGAPAPSPEVVATGPAPSESANNKASVEETRPQLPVEPSREKPSDEASQSRSERRTVILAVAALACIALLMSAGVVGLAWKEEPCAPGEAAISTAAPALTGMVATPPPAPVKPSPPAPLMPSPSSAHETILMVPPMPPPPSLHETKLMPRTAVTVFVIAPQPTVEPTAKRLSAIDRRAQSMRFPVEKK